MDPNDIYSVLGELVGDRALVGALSNKGTVLDELGRSEEAIQSYDKALVIDPNYTYALNNKANSLVNLVEGNESATPISNYQNLFNNLAKINFSLGIHGYPPRPLDYSRSVLAELDEDSFLGLGGLDENKGISASTPPGLTAIYGYEDLTGGRFNDAALAGTPIDWNHNRRATDTHVTSNINYIEGNTGCNIDSFDTLKGHDDWSSLFFNFQASPLFSLGAVQSPDSLEDELTVQDVQDMILHGTNQLAEIKC